MRTVELVPGLPSSVLGFGCAPVLGAVDAATARRALDCALECGITHFDLARSYGYGEAEGFVGRWLGGRRDQVVLATKFGIRATPLARLLAPLKPLVRRLRPTKPGIGAAPAPARRAVVDRFHERLPITPASLTQSLDESLRSLRTDRIDILFIHEPRETLTELEGLCERALALKSAGKIRAWGLAIASETLDLHDTSLERFDVLQVDNHPGSPYDARLRATRRDQPNVFFSPLRGAAATGTSPAETLRQLHETFPRTVILCSMFRCSHVRSNAALFTT